MTVDAIFCADTHLRSDTPRSRTDDFYKTLQTKFEFILQKGKELQCPILIAGDLGHRSSWPWSLYSWFIRIINYYDADIICIPGQHDLPNHRIDKMVDAPIGVADMSDFIIALNEEKITRKEFVVHGFPFGVKVSGKLIPDTVNIALTHQMVIEDKPEWEGQAGTKAITLLRRNNFDVILSGDNHKPFVVKYKNKLLVNPGSMMRSNADQANHKPRIYLYNAEENDVTPLFLPIEKDVLKEAPKDSENRKKRYEAFVENLQEDKGTTVKFEDNVERYFSTNRTRKNIKERVWEIIEMVS